MSLLKRKPVFDTTTDFWDVLAGFFKLGASSKKVPLSCICGALHVRP